MFRGTEGGTFKAGPAAGVRRYGAGTSRMGLNDHVGTFRQRQPAQCPAKIEQFGDGAGPNDAALPKHAVIEGIRTGEGTRVGEARRGRPLPSR